MNTIKKLNRKQFDVLFEVKPFNNQFKCYGSWNGLDLFELGDTKEIAQNKMIERLTLNNWM